MKSTGKKQKQISLFGKESEDYLFDAREQSRKKRLDGLTDFIIERHRIYLRRRKGAAKPWTKDPILRAAKFTNIYRELDPGTTWIYDNIIKPYEDHPYLWLLLCIARTINYTPSLQDLLDAKVMPNKSYDPRAFYEVLQNRADNKKQVVTGAYIVNSVFPRDHKKLDGTLGAGGSKAEYIAYISVLPLWRARKEIQYNFQNTFQQAADTLYSFHGYGPFVTYQVLGDLSYSNKWLGVAKDKNSFTSPGPGTQRGINWLHHGSIKQRGDNEVIEVLSNAKEQAELLRKYRVLANDMIKEKVGSEWTGNFKTGFAEITMGNWQNCMCESSKMIRSILDGGTDRIKNRYKGT